MAFQIYKSGNLFYSNKEEAIALASTSFLGELKNGKVNYSIYEVAYLLEKEKAELIDSKNKKISMKELVKKLGKSYQNYVVFRNLRNKGDILKEGLKYGSDFRVYKAGDKPGKAHAKYLVYVIGGKNINVLDFAAKARIAHSTKKILLLAIVDSEEDVSYYEVNWKS
jgi:tRNA-intron endonuclease